ncbi:MAG: hypothetical protein NVS2B17_10630 [Candidatus Velthaea sp.]
MTKFPDIIRALALIEARFVVIGGVALVLHGSSYITADLDLAYDRTRDNAKRVAAALAQFSPRPRGMPIDLPFRFDDQSLLSSQVLTLATNVGDLDLLGEVAGIGTFAQVEQQSQELDYQGIRFRVLSIDGLLAAKRAAGREKDRPGILELEALKEIRAAQGEG